VRAWSKLRPHVRAGDIALVASAVFSTRAWLDSFGSRYYGIKDDGVLVERCAAGRLPDGWRSLHFGHRRYLFYTGEPATRRPGELTPEQIELLRRADRLGLEFGEQKKYARLFDCSESQISRVLASLRRTRTRKARTPDLSGVVIVSALKAERVFEVLLTVKEWVAFVGRPYYQINDIQYVYQLCAGKPNGASKSPTSLPPGWLPVRMGESWLIYHETRSRRAEFVISGGGPEV
jgi:hypothetical protein